MAIQLDAFTVNPSAGGNNCITIGGRINLLSTPTPWTNRLSNALALTGFLTLTPTGALTLSSGTYGSIFHNQGPNLFQGTFLLQAAGGTTNKLAFQVWDGRAGDGNQAYIRRATTIDPVLVLNQQLRIGFRWRAADQRIELWLNGRETGVVPEYLHNSTVVSGAGGIGVPTHLTNVSTTSGPIEIGAVSHLDRRAFTGIYSEAALFIGWLSTADMIRYGRDAWSPNLLASGVPFRIRYVDLRSDLPTWTSTFMGNVPAGTVVDRWTGEVFGGSEAQGTINYGGIFEHWTRVPHPLVYEAVPPTDADADARPYRYLEPGELDGSGLGARSGGESTVTTAGGLRTALLAAQPGDIINVDHVAMAATQTTAITLTNSLALPNVATQPITASTPRMPPRSTRFLTGRTPLSSAAAPVSLGTPSCEACEPSYVLVRSTGHASLPPRTFRDVTLADGETVRVLDESAKVNEAHYGAMATVRGVASGNDFLIDNGFNGNAWAFSHVAFHGIRFQASARQNGDGQGLMWLAGSGGLSWSYQGNPTKIGDHLVFDQCAIEADPLNTGASSGQIAFWDGRYLAMVNTMADKFWTISGGDGKLFSMNGGTGPYHFENSDFRSTQALWFTGGGGSNLINANPSDVIFRRCWLGPPMSWFPSEVMLNRSPYVVTIAANGTTVTRVSGGIGGGWGAAGPAFRPDAQGIMYQMTTGIARSFVASDNYTSELTALSLTAAWPTTGTITVAFQRTTPDPQTTPTIYNSGVETPPATASVAVGSRHVVVSAPLPAAVQVGHYFYLNNTYWDTAYQSEGVGFYTPVAANNGWGFQQGVTRAQSKRKRIASIAGDRLSFETDPTQDPVTTVSGANETFPYSIVRGDGLYRNSMYHYKGSWENKRGVRWLIEGNVFEHTTNRCYAVTQPGGDGFLGSVTIATDAQGISTATLASGVWDSRITGSGDQRGKYGSPYPYTVLFASGGANGAGPIFYIPENYPPARYIKRVLSPTTAELYPLDPRIPGQPGNGTQTMAWVVQSTPWLQIKHFMVRYNLWTRGNGSPFYRAEGTHGGQVLPGGHLIVHDNLFMRLGDQAFPDGHATGWGMLAPASTAKPHWNYGPGGQAGYDEPFTNTANGLWRHDHNSYVRTLPTTATLNAIIAPLDSTPEPTTPTRASFCDSLILGANGATNIFGIWPSCNLASVTSFWHPSNAMARNVFAGATMPAKALAQLAAFPDNGAVTTEAEVGVGPNYLALDGYAPTNYTLQDIATVAGFTIAADGLGASLPSGSLPDSIQIGHLVKTTTHPEFFRVTERGQLFTVSALTEDFTAANGVLGVTAQNTWTGHPGFTILSNEMRFQDLGGGFDWTRCTTDLGSDDHEVEIVIRNISGGSSSQCGITARASAAANGTFYLLQTVGTGQIRIRPVISGNIQLASPPTASGLSLVPGDRLKLRVAGSTISGYLNDVLLVSMTDTLITTGRNVGFQGLTISGSATTTFDTMRARTAQATPGVRWVNVAGATLVHPEAGATGKSLLVTFKGTARDNTDPGADIPGLAAMIQGVRNPARAEQ